MKLVFKTLLKYYLKYITKLVLFVHRPTIIAIAGSTNKTFVKEEIKHVLEEKGMKVRANQNSFNTEIGLPLAVLDLPSGYNHYKKWLPTLYRSILSLWQKDFPLILILELGASSRGDMKHLLSIIKPKISVITDITQRYLENFSDMNDMADEYKTLIRKTKRDGQVIINCDNIKLRKMFKNIRARKQSFGFFEKCDWHIMDHERTEKGEKFHVEHNNKNIQKEVDRFGIHHVYATTVGLIINEIFNGK
ncbi:MAG: Mur ligase family protein [Parcubacteria group bacterium]|jgi:UDP-N-acetylmuramoyl-tripeptide--D-alanyl-D-alanine ligase